MRRHHPRWIVPEVVQTSNMDCGPASLKALLEGFGVPVSYGRLREACQTDVDGTSIDTIEDVARQLGLDAEQLIVPADHLLEPEAGYLPALVVVRHPDGQTHFLVAWRRVGPWVQLMDPAVGRRWVRVSRFLSEVYLHGMPLPAEGWREWAASDDFLKVLRARLRALGLSASDLDAAVQRALADPSWRGLAGLDAVTRMVEAIVVAGGARRGREAAGLHRALVERLAAEPDAALDLVPRGMWSASDMPPDPEGTPQVLVRGAVLVRVAGATALDLSAPPEEGRAALSPELVAALTEPPVRPGRALWDSLRADGLLVPGVLLGALALSSGAVLIEALLFRGLFDLAVALALPVQRALGLAAILLFGLALLLVEGPLQAGALRMGRLLELRSRVAFQQKIPRLGDRYFQSRPTSDMAERSHAAHMIRTLPALGFAFLRAIFGLVFTTAALCWLDPGVAPWAVLSALASVAVPLATWPLLVERDMRFRTHLGALSRFYLDALQGLVALRTHGAELAVRRQHEALLSSWTRAGLDLQRLAVVVEGLGALAGFLVAGGLLASHLSRNPAGGSALLLAWWALSLPALGQAVALSARQYPAARNTTLRLLEPLGAPDETDGLQVRGRAGGEARGVAIDLQGVAVRAAGHTILEDVTLAIAPGEEVGVVGASGAGKSSLLGLLLGWHRAGEGKLSVDGEPLRGEALARLRRDTAWVDPAVQVWNRPFLDNLLYGADEGDAAELGRALETADLGPVLEVLPDGLQTRLGEGGALLSGGQGQRVRLGRAALRRDARLVLLDEPFRGLDRARRHDLLARARRRWKGATFLVVTHDVGDTFDLPRVLVVEGGRIVEDGAPAELAARPSRYRALLEAEAEVRDGLWRGADWRRFTLAEGRLVERGREEAS